MKFKKTIMNAMKCFVSECEEYKVINYGGEIYCFYKIDGIHHNGQKYRAFGDSCEHTNIGKSQTYKSYREGFKAVERYVKQEEK